MRVVYLIPGIPAGGGAENIVRDLCRSIERARFQLEVWYWNEDDGLAAAIRAAGAVTVKLPLKKIVSVGSVFYIAQLLKEKKVDLAHTCFLDGDLLGFGASRLAGLPMIVHVHSHPFLALRRHAWRYRLMGWGIDRIVCVSALVRDHVRAMTGLGPDKFAVIHNGIDREAFVDRLSLECKQALRISLGFKADDYIIGNVSHLTEKKGNAVLLKALPAVMARYPQVKALIVGDGPLAQELQALARVGGIGSRVVFAGQRQDVPEMLACMDMFVFPTLRDAFGLAVVEAMAAGKPVISSADTGVAEIVRDGQDGLLLKPGDHQGLAQAILRLMEDPALAQRLALCGLERSREFTLEVMARRFESLYEQSGRKASAQSCS